MTITPADLLRQSADLIERVGHAQFLRRGIDGSVCATYAISNRLNIMGRYEFDTYVETIEALAEHIGDGKSAAVPAIVRWNDDPATTAEMVIKTMRAVADELESEK